MHTGKRLIIILLLLQSSISCAPKVEQGYDPEKGYMGNISLSGAFALYPIVVMWAEDFRKIHPHVRFNISAGGAGKGIADVLSNMVDIGLVSRDLHPQELQKGAYPIFVAKDAVLGTYNPAHPNHQRIQQRGMTQDELKGIFIEKRYSRWVDLDPSMVDAPIMTYVRSDAAGAAETWAKFFGASQEDLQGVGIFGDPGLAQAIKDKDLSIGFNNINYIYDLRSERTTADIAVIPIDKNNNGRIDEEERFYQTLGDLTAAVAAGDYPAPPSRDLAFVVHKDQDSKLIQEFIRFVLDSAQQGYLLENGYVPLNAVQQQEERSKIASHESKTPKR